MLDVLSLAKEGGMALIALYAVYGWNQNTKVLSKNTEVLSSLKRIIAERFPKEKRARRK